MCERTSSSSRFLNSSAVHWKPTNPIHAAVFASCEGLVDEALELLAGLRISMSLPFEVWQEYVDPGAVQSAPTGPLTSVHGATSTSGRSTG